MVDIEKQLVEVVQTTAIIPDDPVVARAILNQLVEALDERGDGVVGLIALNAVVYGVHLAAGRVEHSKAICRRSAWEQFALGATIQLAAQRIQHHVWIGTAD